MTIEEHNAICGTCIHKVSSDDIKAIRANAIEEFVDELVKPSNYERFDFDDCLDSSDKTNDFFKYVFAMAEKVKNK